MLHGKGMRGKDMKVDDPKCGECIHFSHFEWMKFEGVEPDDTNYVYKCNGRKRAVFPQTHWCCDESAFESRVNARNRYKALWSSAVVDHLNRGASVEDAVRHGDEAVRMIIEHDDWEKRVERPRWSVTAELE